MNEPLKKSSNVCYILSLIVFALGALAAVPLRCFQLLNLINNNTGFYLRDSKAILLLNTGLAAVTFFCIITSFVGRKRRLRPLGKNIPMSAVSFLFSFCLICDGVKNIYEVMLHGIRFEKGFIFLQGIFALLSAVFFIITAISFAIGTDTFTNRGILAITPVFWSITRVLQRFSKAIDFKNVSELLFELFMLCFAMLFFMAFARVFINTDEGTSTWRIFGFGLPAALFALLCTLPRFYLIFSGNSELIVKGSPAELVDLGMAVFIITCTVRFVTAEEAFFDFKAPPKKAAKAVATTQEEEYPYTEPDGYDTVQDAFVQSIPEQDEQPLD